MLSGLLVRCGAGDRAAFERLLALLYPAVLAGTAAGTPGQREDQVRRAFVAIWRESPTYAPGRLTPVAWIKQRVSEASAADQDVDVEQMEQ